MADSYHIIDGQVVPYCGGRRCNDTDAWRDATPLELQLQEQLEESEHTIATLQAEIEALRAEVERLKSENARIREALQAIVDEVSDGLVPYSSDSYLPAHLVEQARAVLSKENSND